MSVPVTRLLNLALPLVRTHGFSREALARSVLELPAAEAHSEPLSETAVSALFGEGDNARRTLINHWLMQGVRHMQNVEESPTLNAVLRKRLEYNEPLLERLPEAFALLATPGTGALPLDPRPALHHASRIADEACYVIGDKSLHLSWYSKRASIAAVYTAAELHQLASPNTAYAFLDDLLRKTAKAGSAIDELRFSLVLNTVRTAKHHIPQIVIGHRTQVSPTWWAGHWFLSHNSHTGTKLEGDSYPEMAGFWHSMQVMMALIAIVFQSISPDILTLGQWAGTSEFPWELICDLTLTRAFPFTTISIDRAMTSGLHFTPNITLKHSVTIPVAIETAFHVIGTDAGLERVGKLSKLCASVDLRERDSVVIPPGTQLCEISVITQPASTNDGVIVANRQHFTLVESMPMMFGLVHAKVTLKGTLTWLEPSSVPANAPLYALYETTDTRSGIKVWKIRKFEEQDAGDGRRSTTVSEELRIWAPTYLRAITQHVAAKAHSEHVDSYCALFN